MTAAVIIYALHGADDAVRYVGKTKLSMDGRFNAHVSSSKGSDLPLYVWMRDNMPNVFSKVLEVIECQGDGKLTANGFEREAFWIKHHLERGDILFNIKARPASFPLPPELQRPVRQWAVAPLDPRDTNARKPGKHPHHAAIDRIGIHRLSDYLKVSFPAILGWRNRGVPKGYARTITAFAICQGVDAPELAEAMK